MFDNLINQIFDDFTTQIQSDELAALYYWEEIDDEREED